MQSPPPGFALFVEGREPIVETPQGEKAISVYIPKITASLTFTNGVPDEATYRWLGQLASNMSDLGSVYRRNGSRVASLVVRSGYRFGHVTGCDLGWGYRRDYGPPPPVNRPGWWLASIVLQSDDDSPTSFHLYIPHLTNGGAGAQRVLAEAITAIETAYHTAPCSASPRAAS